MLRVEGEAAGQNEERYSRLRGLIDRYPKDAGILKELVQNADDGRARQVRIILDTRRCRPTSTPHESLLEVSGAAIIAWNDQPFEQQDFMNLEQLANSAKIEDAFKTGRFGLGFNAVYNITDFPLLLTEKKLWCLDPCETLLENPKGGIRWELEQLVEGDADGILELFKPVGYQAGSAAFPATAIRLPLRNKDHIHRNQDPERPGEALISSEVFTPQDFNQIVDGLGDIAHELLLFLKNVESVSCLHLDSEGNEIPLLEVRTTNPETVRAGREQINRLLRDGLDATLNECSKSNNQPLESCYPIDIEVTRSGAKPERSRWLVVSGLYPGEENSLLDASRELHKAGERGLPHSGVAVCLEKDGKSFPAIQGRLFCYLPIAGREYAGNFPVHVHGAFSLDNSRTTLSGHREDEHGKVAALAAWNELLLTDATAKAYTRALREITLLPSTSGSLKQLASQLYCLFPSVNRASGTHAKLLAKSTLTGLGNSEVFRTASGKWVILDKVLSIPDDDDLRSCLEKEHFPIAEPPIPSDVVKGLSSIDRQVPALTADHIVERFRMDGSGSWLIDEAPFEGLRNRDAIVAVSRFLARVRETDWSLLPLAISDDGRLRTYPTDDEQPLFIATEIQKAIYDWFPDWFLEESYCESCRLSLTPAVGFEVMSTQTVLVHLDKMILDPNTGASCWDPDGEESPNNTWLINLYREIICAPEIGEPDELDTLLKVATIIPADDNHLYRPGVEHSPLLVPNNEASLAPLLKTLGIRHFVLDPQHPLTKVLKRFRSKTELLWKLTPEALIDSIGANLDQLLASVDEWRTEKTASYLVKFLSRIDGELSIDRKATLRRLPIWKEASGGYSHVGDKDYLQGEFKPPAIPNLVRIFADGDQAKLLKVVGLIPIGYRELLTDHLVPHLQTLEENEFLEATKWIRDNWQLLCGEFDDGEKELITLLANKKLVLDQEGERSRACDLYLGEASKLAAEVLGSRVRTPSPECYSTDAGLWLTFFKNLKILKAPSPQHLVEYLESVVEKCEGRRASPQEEACLIRVLQHVRDKLSGLADWTVNSLKRGKVNFADFLAETAWVPAHRQANKKKDLGAWQEPAERLFKPSELIHFNLGARCASTRPLSPRGTKEFSEHDRKRLNIVRLPSAADICGHLMNTIQDVGEAQLSEDECATLAKVLEEIYRGLGELKRQAEKEGDSHGLMADLEGECRELAQLPCLLDLKIGRLRLPRDVYKGEAGKLAPLKTEITGGSPDIESGMALLGRLDRPGPEDLAATLRELADHGGKLEEVRLKAAVACIDRLTTLLRDDPDLDRPRVALPNALAMMIEPDDLLIADDTMLTESLSIPEECLLHDYVSPGIVDVIDIARLSSAQAERSGDLVSCHDPMLEERCAELQRLLRSPEFLEGLERILTSEGGRIQVLDFKWLNSIEVTACETVTCDYHIKLKSGRTLHLGSAESEVVFAAIGEGGEFLVSRRSGEARLLNTHFLREFLKQLDQVPGKDANLLAILSDKPEQIHDTLNRLHVGGLHRAEHNAEDSAGPTVFGSAGSEPGNEEEQPVSPQSEMTEGGEPGGESEFAKLAESIEEAEAIEDSEVDEDVDRTGVAGPSHRSGERRMRILKGDKPTKKREERWEKSSRQQDGDWFSRPWTEEQLRQERKKSHLHNDEDEGGRSHEIGDKAVGWVLQYEHSQGRKPMSMGHANRGYDVESKKGRGVERYIEVKGIDGEWMERKGVLLSSKQFFRAMEPEDPNQDDSSPMGDKFWLYVVEHACEPDQMQIHMIQNPAARATWFGFDHGWQHSGKAAEGFQPLVPRKGLKIRRIFKEGGYEEGEILEVEAGGKLIMLKVVFENYASKRFTYDPTCHLLVT